MGQNLPEKYDGGETYRKKYDGAKLTANIRWGETYRKYTMGQNLPPKYDGGETYHKNMMRANFYLPQKYDCGGGFLLNAKIRWGKTYRKYTMGQDLPQKYDGGETYRKKYDEGETYRKNTMGRNLPQIYDGAKLTANIRWGKTYRKNTMEAKRTAKNTMRAKLTAKIRWGETYRKYTMGQNLPQKYDGSETYRKNTMGAKLTAKIRWRRNVPQKIR